MLQARDEGSFSFEGYTLDRRRRCLCQGNRDIELRPKSFDLLCYLAENAGRLLSKDDIATAVWPGIVATDESIARCVSDVRLALGDGAQRIIKTVPRHGYLFAAPVASLRRVPLLMHPDAALPELPRLSVVVLPFVALGNTAPDYFADAVTCSVTTDLARIPDAFVIAANTAFSYKGRAVDARQIGRDLGVRYVVAGSMLGGADRIRVHAQLADAATGTLLWADRFDERRTDLLEMQDDITARLARGIGIELVAIESQRADRNGRAAMDSRDLSLRGRAILNRPQSFDATRKARGWFEEALRRDGDNVDALLGLAWTHSYEVANWLSERPAEQTQAAEAAISRAVALAPGDANVHFLRAAVSQISQPPEVTLRAYELAICLDPSHAPAHAAAGIMKLYLGRPQETEEHVSKAIRLNPRDPRLHVWYFYAGAADFFLGRVDRSLDRFRKALELNPRQELANIYLTGALAEAGRPKEAAAAREASRRLAPTFGVARYVSELRSDNPVYLAQRERMVQAMRKAGIPD